MKHRSGRTDIFTKKKRSDIMSRIRGRDTSPELFVAAAVRKMGYRIQMHTTNIPGRPDIFIRSLQTAIFVNGCFWHLHPRCKNARIPKSNVEFWKKKLMGNRARDARVRSELRKEGIRVIVLWECKLEKLKEDISAFLEEELAR